MPKITFTEIGCEQYKVIVDGKDIGWFGPDIEIDGIILNPGVVPK